MDLGETPPSTSNTIQLTNSGQAQGNVAAGHIGQLTQNFPSSAGSFDFSKKSLTQHLLKYGKEKFVETSVYTTALDCLQRHGCVTLTGGPGDGKTAMACRLLRLHHQQGARLVVLQEPADLTRLLDLPAPEEGSTVVFVDDIFGQFTATQEKVQTWREPLKKANLCLMSQTSPETKHRFYFLFTSRQLQVREAEPGLDSLHHSLFREDRVVDVGKLTEADKRKVFFHHAKLHKRENEFFLHQIHLITILPVPHGFPHICHLFFDQNIPKEKLADFFNKPFDYVSSSIKQILKEKPAQALLLTCLMLSDGRLCLDTLDEEAGSTISKPKAQGGCEKGNLLHRARSLVGCDDSISAEKVKRSVNELQGSYVCREGDEWAFSHPLFHDIVCFLHGKLNPELVVEHCSRLFLYERVTLCLGSENDQWSVRLSPKHRPLLISRFVRELVGGLYFFVSLHPALTESGLVEEIVDKLHRENDLKTILTEEDKEGHGSFLVCSVYSQSKLFHELFRICRESDSLSQTCLSDASLKAIVTQCCVNDNVSPLDDLKEYVSHFNFLKLSHQAQLLHQLFIATSIIKTVLLPTFMHLCEKRLQEEVTDSDRTLEGLMDTVLPHFENDQYCQTTLSLAVLQGSSRAVEKLLTLTSDVLTPDQVRDAFLMACMVDNADAVSSIAHHRHLFLHLEVPLLTLPVLFGAAAVAKTLVSILREWGYDKERLRAEVVGGKDKSNKTPLKMLMMLGQTQLIELTTPCRMTPLMFSSFQGHGKMVDVLIPFSDVKTTTHGGFTVLMQGSLNGHNEVVKLLIPNSNVKAATQRGFTALMLGAQNGHSEVVQLLIPHSDVKAVEEKGLTALMLAAQNGHSKVVQLLIQHSDVKAVTHDGLTALMLAAQNGHSEVVRLLIPHSDVQAATKKYGVTSVMLGAYNGHSEVVRLLIPHSRVKAATQDGWTALMLGALKGHTEVVHFLIQHSDVKAAKQDGFTALMIGAYIGHSEVVRLLIPHSDVKAVTDGFTALMIGAENGHIEVVRLLIPHSCVKAARQNGDTALTIAVRQGHLDIVDVLTSHLALSSSS